MRPTAGIHMLSGNLNSSDTMIAAMSATKFHLTNINRPYDDLPESKARKICDLCALMPIQVLKRFGSTGCNKTVYPNRASCEICNIFGRYCCSWTSEKFIGKLHERSPAVLSGTQAQSVQLNNDILAKHKVVTAAMICQPRWDKDSAQSQEQLSFGHSFTQTDNVIPMEDSFPDDGEDDEEVVEDSEDGGAED
ncbi:hypothetical protein GQ44DRAFT_706017 [Phaeosphaeriaceae sp. PMI808]|nr:hypothetical protein GQ44DRAFT_706017 [Phaeosphaeriaceae sp. PMI808]